jgi:cysteine desulfurase/selenocysteine lyase
MITTETIWPYRERMSASGKPLVYLDNAATSQKPQCVIDAIHEFYAHGCSNVHRGAYALSTKATNRYEAARATVAAYCGVEIGEVVFTKGTTESMNLAATVLSARLSPGDEILLSEMEHHANIVPWVMAAERTGAVIRVIPVLEDGTLDMDSARELIGERTRIVSITQVSNVLGTVNDVRAIADMAHALGALMVVDGAQGVAHRSTHVHELGADLYAFSAHKVYGPMGTGVLIGRRDLLATLAPYQGGGAMIDQVHFDKVTYAEPPQRFEAGTPHVPGVIGLGVALDWLSEQDHNELHARERVMRAIVREALQRIDGSRIYGPEEGAIGIVSFTIDGVHASDIGTIMDQYGVAIRVGHHCAQPLMRRFGVTGMARVSFGASSTIKDAEAGADAIARTVRMLR